ncbi:MAG: hypothetical protein IKW37_01315 [Bacteroidaceae bacterium]|nr:hypothetical protein [Bacteroidaceae bacterium]
MAYRCKTHESKECDGCGECIGSGRTVKKYGVTLTLEQIEVEAESENEAIEKALVIYYADKMAKIEAGMIVVDYEVVKLDEEEE